MKKLSKELIFAAVDESNKRFSHYSDEERRAFATHARQLGKTKIKLIMSSLYGQFGN